MYMEYKVPHLEVVEVAVEHGFDLSSGQLENPDTSGGETPWE